MTRLKDVRNDYHGVTTLTSDIDNSETNIALLAFKVATGDSLTKFEMVDQVIDEYIDSSGIDTGNSTNELVETGYVRGETIVGSTPTGGTVTTYGSTVVNTFLASGNFTTPSLGLVDVLVVAGGGGGGDHGGAGGGAGGVRQLTGITANVGANAIVVGSGGPPNQASGSNGGTSSALGQVCTGGGGGGRWDQSGIAGGSGGGGGGNASGGGYPGGSGNAGGYSPSEGNGGGPGAHSPGNHASGGGGGGAGAGGSSASGAQGGHAGDGVQNNYRTGSNIYYGGGGGGGAFYSSGGGNGGQGGGGHGYDTLTAGDPNTGGGGGGGYHYGGSGAVGGSGIVVIKYADDTFLQSSAGDLTLVSTATTAQTEPVTGDVVMLLEDGSGTASLNTDIKAHVSRDDGTTWTETTLTNEGSWGTNKHILVARDVDISSQPSGTSMRYKIETFGQAGSDAHTVTAAGGAVTSTTQQKYGTASMYTSGNSDYLSIPNSDEFNFGNGNFTIEAWIYHTGTSSYQTIATCTNTAHSTYWQFRYFGGSGNFDFWVTGDTNGVTFNPGSQLTVNTWNHLAISRNGSSWYGFLNGTQVGATQTNTFTMTDVDDALEIGGPGWLGQPFIGYIDEFRISNSARYTANFTPTVHTTDANTVLLLHMDGANNGTTFTDDDYVKETRIHATSLAWK